MTFTNYRDDTGTRLRFAQGTAGPAGGSLELELVEATACALRWQSMYLNERDQVAALERRVKDNDALFARYERELKQELKTAREALESLRNELAPSPAERTEESHARHI